MQPGLGAIGPGAGPAASALVTALEDKDGAVAERAAAALRSLGRGARQAVPQLLAIWRRADERLLDNATATLVGLDVEAVPAVVGALKDKDERVRERALDLIQSIEEEGTDTGAEPALLVAAKDSSGGVYCAVAVRVLGRLRSQRCKKAAIEALFGSLADSDASVRSAAADSLLSLSSGIAGDDAAPRCVGSHCRIKGPR